MKGAVYAIGLTALLASPVMAQEVQKPTAEEAANSPEGQAAKAQMMEIYNSILKKVQNKVSGVNNAADAESEAAEIKADEEGHKQRRIENDARYKAWQEEGIKRAEESSGDDPEDTADNDNVAGAGGSATDSGQEQTGQKKPDQTTTDTASGIFEAGSDEAKKAETNDAAAKTGVASSSDTGTVSTGDQSYSNTNEDTQVISSKDDSAVSTQDEATKVIDNVKESADVQKVVDDTIKTANASLEAAGLSGDLGTVSSDGTDSKTEKSTATQSTEVDTSCKDGEETVTQDKKDSLCSNSGIDGDTCNQLDVKVTCDQTNSASQENSSVVDEDAASTDGV